ncbi:pesticin C-terminus-like muramidase [Rahnella sp. PAMC 25559]|uniref:pesticin C-terminus-like muramidase n=1 Tax=Rahnella sp. PAMC 25559 TaxID=3423225 RepID=UPI003D66403E
MTMTADVAGTPLKRGERVWVVADGGNLEAVDAQTGSSPKFVEVITDQTIPVQAGAALGHLGFFQIPTETGFRSRYMVHIECLTSDSKVASFLTNPEAAGRESPAFLKYPADATLFSKDAQGAMAESSRKTKAPGILTLSNVPAVSADGTPTHYQIRPEGGFLAADSVEKLSQFDLGKLGFSIIKDDPESFQLLDAENQPQNVVKGIFEKLKAAAEDDPAFSNALASHKYKQLLDVIDQNHDGYYSVDEYRNAVHNPTYRDQLYQLIVQHPSEWYYEKTDAKWTKYLEKLEPDASKWKKYTEAFLDKMIWMKKVAGMGPAPWHMHPVMFMGALASDDGMDLKWLLVPKGQLTFDAEGNDIESSPWFSRKIHWPGGVSGITIGRGYDLGQNNSSNNELTEVGVDENLKSWLVGSQSMSGATASTRLNGAPTSIRQLQITRKQQYDLFIITYQKLEDDVKRICQKTATIQAYHPNTSVTSDQAWDDIPQKIKEILVDLRYRGDYTPTIRSHLQHAAYAGDLSTFGSVLSNSSLWKNVPNDRFQRRVNYYEHN